MKKKKSKARRRTENIILFILIFIAVVCFGIVLYKLGTYYKEDHENKDIAAKYSFRLDVPDKPIEVPDDDDIKNEPVQTEETDTDDGSYDDVGIDYESLLGQNGDYAGWIRMANGVNYPIVRGKTTTEYLHLNFYKKYAYSGTIIMESANRLDYSDPNTILYGHNMADGSMFAMNHKYKAEEYAKDNPYFFIHIKGGYFTYKVIACMVTKDGSKGYSMGLENKDYFEDYKGFVQENSLYMTEEPQFGDRLVTLSTCTGRVGGTTRLLVIGKLKYFTTYSGIRVSGNYYFNTKPADEIYNPFLTKEIVNGQTERHDG